MVFVDYEKEISRVVVVLLSLVCVCGKPAKQPNWTCTKVLVVSHVLCPEAASATAASAAGVCFPVGKMGTI